MMMNMMVVIVLYHLHYILMQQAIQTSVIYFYIKSSEGNVPECLLYKKVRKLQYQVASHCRKPS